MPTSAVNRRFTGMVIAVAIAYATVALPPGSDALGPVSGLRGLGLVGAPVAALLGWWLTRWVAGAAWRIVLGIGVGMGVLAAVLGVLELAYLQLLNVLITEPDPDGSSVTVAIFIAFYGLPYAALALPITIPCGVLWAVVVRALFARRFEEPAVPSASIGPRHVLVALAVVAIGAALVKLANFS